MSKQVDDLSAVRKALRQLKALGAVVGQNVGAFTRASTVTLTFSVLAFGNGVGMIALAVAEYSWLSEWTRRSALRMGDEQMEQRSTTRPGVVAAILGELQPDPYEHTNDALAKLAITRIARDIAPRSSPSKISASGFVECTILNSGNQPALTFDLPKGFCYPATSAGPTDFSIAVPPDEAEHLSSGVASALWQELAAAMELEKSNLPPEFLQIYFISSRGLLALRGPRASKIAQQNLMRRWEAVTYFQSFVTGKMLDKDSNYITQTYLDLAGTGLVKTVCSAVTGARGALGIVCGDISINISRLNPACEKVSERRSRVCSWQTGVFDYTLFTVADDLRPSSYPRELSSQVVYALSEMAETQTGAPVQWVQPMQGALTLNWHHDTPDATGAAESGTETYERQAGNGGGFLVDLGRPELAGPRVFVLLRPREEPLEPVIFIVGGSLLVTLACGLLAMAAIRSGRVNQASEQATILRNLSVAVVQVDEDGRIAAANDRAEQVLGARLPKFGEFDLGTPDRLRVANRSTFFEIFDGPLFRRNGPCFDQVAEAAIVRARRAGMNSEYFGKIADNNRWIRVAGAPLLARSNTTFCVLMSATDQELNDLDAASVQRAPTLHGEQGTAEVETF